ncbi:MAG: 2-C-methyl-D-erythritol 4-phosphate cytidylyltransferase [Ignavibacteria bacterium]|jgi:2-C-methyl-D-erythritol 4-phosphate cytidylyltransferase
MKTYAIIPSGGESKRFGGNMPKQYLQVNDKEIIVHTLEIFQNCNLVDEIIIAARKNYFNLINELKVKYKINKLTKLIEGGATRQESVANALFSINNIEDNDLIAVHDAARPLLSKKILIDSINSAKIFDSIVVAINAKDTLLKGNDFVENYVDRKNIWYAQTPQVFKYHIINHSMKKAINEKFIGTDESMLVNRAGYKVKFVRGEATNFKITTLDDFNLFKSLTQK